MLDAFIIEELKKREQSQSDHARPTLEIPADEELPPEKDEGVEDEEDEGRVIIIDYND